jgi:hypothetical protein
VVAFRYCAPRTVTNAINALRADGLIVGVPGGGW